MTEGVDQSVGRIVDRLEELSLTENTLVIFFSDNGGVRSRAFNGPFRSGKGFIWEGGIRVPLIVTWPRVIEPGTVSETPVTSVDFYPTLLDVARVEDHASDGQSLLPLFTQADSFHQRSLFWHYPHYSNAGATPTGAIRTGHWKLIEFFEDGHVELYNLSQDPGETMDVASDRPEQTKAMRDELVRWRSTIGAKPAIVNPAFDPGRAKERVGFQYKPRWDETQPLVNPSGAGLNP